MKVDRSFNAARRKKVFFGIGFLLGVYFLASFTLGEMGLVKYYRMKSQYHALIEEIAQLKQDNAKFTKKVHSLRSDLTLSNVLQETNWDLRVRRDSVLLWKTEHLLQISKQIQNKLQTPISKRLIFRI
jgi:cell division protein FtsB